MAVYFAQAGGYVKIGYSAAPIARSATLTTHGKRPADLPRGADVDLLGWVPGDERTEGWWHAQFIADHVAGEWFYLDPDMIRERIWSDPCGVDVHRMSALAVFAADAHPEMTRNEIAAAGVRIAAPSQEEAMASFNRRFSAALGGAA